jgi:hypothetical protein
VGHLGYVILIRSWPDDDAFALEAPDDHSPRRGDEKVGR